MVTTSTSNLTNSLAQQDEGAQCITRDLWLLKHAGESGSNKTREIDSKTVSNTFNGCAEVVLDVTGALKLVPVIPHRHGAVAHEGSGRDIRLLRSERFCWIERISDYHSETNVWLEW